MGGGRGAHVLGVFSRDVLDVFSRDISAQRASPEETETLAEGVERGGSTCPAHSALILPGGPAQTSQPFAA